MRFPLIGPGYTGFSSQGDSVRNVNLFIHKGAKGAKNELCLLGSPGEILRFNVGNSPVRDMHVVGNVLYAVAGKQLYTISLNGTITAVPGAVLNTSIGPVIIKDNALAATGTGGSQIMITDGVLAYVYNVASPSWTNSSSFAGNAGGGSGSVITLPLGALEYIDGYFVAAVPGTMALYSSDLYQGTWWSTLAVSYAQGVADSIQALLNMQEQLIIIKQFSTEFWYNTGTATATGFPFSRQSAAVIDYGTVAPASVARATISQGVSSIFMLGSGRVGDGPNFIGVVQMTNDSPTIVSTPAITKQMQAWAPWLDAIGFCYIQDGHIFYEVTSPSLNQTFVYDASIGDPELAWHERSTYVPGGYPYQVNRHNANCYAFFNGMHLVGDWENGNIYQLSTSTYTDNGQPLVAFRQTQILADNKKALKSVLLHRMVLDAEVGQNGGNIAMAFSDDYGNTWSGDYAHSLRVTSDFRGIDPWEPLGLHPYGVTFRISISDNCPRAIFGGYLE